MTRLSETQATILSAAAQRPDGDVLPLPGSLRGGAAGKVVSALRTRGLVRETVTDRLTRADAAMNTVWRNDHDGRAALLRITDAGREAIGVETEQSETDATEAGESAAAAPKGRDEAPLAPAADNPRPQTKVAAAGRDTGAVRKTREGTKQTQLIAMLEREEGVTIEQIVAVTGWQPHTVRGAFAGALKKKLGLTVTSEKVEGRGRVYRLKR